MADNPQHYYWLPYRFGEYPRLPGLLEVSLTIREAKKWERQSSGMQERDSDRPVRCYETLGDWGPYPAGSRVVLRRVARGEPFSVGISELAMIERYEVPRATLQYRADGFHYLRCQACVTKLPHEQSRNFRPYRGSQACQQCLAWAIREHVEFYDWPERRYRVTKLQIWDGPISAKDSLIESPKAKMALSRKCEVCGEAISDSNKYGVCGRTQACYAEQQRRTEAAKKGPPLEPSKKRTRDKCAVCLQPIDDDNRVGVCQRGDCNNIYARLVKWLERREKRGLDRRCEICGERMRVNNQLPICTRAGECWRAHHRLKRLLDAGENPDIADVRDRHCEVCGGLLRDSANSVGVCRKTPECRKEASRRATIVRVERERAKKRTENDAG